MSFELADELQRVDQIARHYLDALAAAPNDQDAAATGEAALSMLVRAAERAERAGAPGRAAASYAAAAELAERGHDQLGPPEDSEPPLWAAALWERAARADVTAADWDRALEHAEAARRSYLEHGEARGAARVRTIAGQALRRAGRHGEARVELSEALAVLRAEPDAGTVAALDELAQLEAFSGNPEGDRLSDEALAMGEALDVDPSLLARLLIGRGIAHAFASRTAVAAAYHREAARLAERVGDAENLGRALLNLSYVLGGTDPLGSAEAARAGADHARRIGARLILAISVANLGNALLELGDWDEAESVLDAAIEDDGLGDNGNVLCLRGLLLALRGNGEEASAVIASLSDFAKTEDLQDLAYVAALDAFSAAALGRSSDALVHARAVLDRAPAIGIRHETVRWCWPLAARAAHELDDRVANAELLALLDAHPLGHLPPLLRAERALAKARLADPGEPEAGEGFSHAIGALRAVASPYHLAHGLLDHARYLARIGEGERANVSADEAKATGKRLRCPPIVRRAESLVKQFASVA